MSFLISYTSVDCFLHIQKTASRTLLARLGGFSTGGAREVGPREEEGPLGREVLVRASRRTVSWRRRLRLVGCRRWSLRGIWLLSPIDFQHWMLGLLVKPNTCHLLNDIHNIWCIREASSGVICSSNQFFPNEVGNAEGRTISSKPHKN